MCKLFKKKKETETMETEMTELKSEQVYHSVKAKVRDFVISKEDPFANDKLDRKKNAEVLTSAAFAYQDGAVLALNGAWGTGKTTFVKMWSQHLKNNGFPVIYYNAWEDDISEEPLFSLLRCLKTVNKEEDKEGKLKKVFSVGSKIIAGIGMGAVKGALGKFGDVAAEAGKSGLDVVEKEIVNSLDKEDETAIVLQQFKNDLVEYVAFVCDNNRPLVYFIDELDRCNPTFAVKVLERIKHLFDVPNVVFVLSIDKQQLAYSINGFYGSEQINSMEYLRRFIDIDYNLPEPDSDHYCEYLYDFYGFADFTESEGRKRIVTGRSVDDKGDLLSIAKLIVKYKHLNLRQTERIFALARIVLCEMATNSKLFADVYFLMTYLKVCEPEVFDNISSFKYSLQDLINTFETMASDELIQEDKKRYGYFLKAVCQLVFCYAESIGNKYRRGDGKYETIYDEQSSDHHANITFNKFDKESGFRMMKFYEERRPDLVCEVEHFTKKLALTEPFQVGVIV